MASLLLIEVEQHLGLRNVPIRPHLDLPEFLVGDHAHGTSRISMNQCSWRDSRSLGHECPGVDDGTSSDRAPVEHRPPDRNARDIFQLASVDDARMRDGHVVTDVNFEVIRRVDDRAFLEICSLTNRDLGIIAANYYSCPDGGIISYFHVPDDQCPGIDVCEGRNFWKFPVILN